MAITAKPGGKRPRHRRREKGGLNGADRFGETAAAPRLLRSLLWAPARPGAERGNENSARPIKNRSCEPDHAGTSPTRDGQRFADTKSDAEKETKGESRQEVSGRGLISDSGPETRKEQAVVKRRLAPVHPFASFALSRFHCLRCSRSRALEGSLLMEGRIRIIVVAPGTVNLRT